MEGVRKQADDVGQADSADVVQQADSPEAAEISTVTVVRKKRSIWADPVVRTMGFALAGLVILYLLAIVSALYFGLIGNPTPRTIDERDLVNLEVIANAQGATADQVQTYILALITDGQFSRAKQIIDQRSADDTLDQVQGENVLFCLAELQRAQGEAEAALATYDEVMTKTKAAYEKEYEEGGDIQNWALAYGLHDNYFLSALSKSVIYQNLEQWDDALEMIDIYLMENPRQAGVLVDRAAIKLKLDDRTGAEADYREALKYVPDFPEALAGLEQMGVGE